MYIKQEVSNTIVIEKSKFITYMKRVKSEEEFKDYLNQIKKKHYDASHVCSGFICHNINRSSDDGEPSGTAGAPILNALVKNNLDEVCALVVRYFGGTKLGTGGLIRAYSSSVTECLNIVTLIEEKEYKKFELTLSYELANKIDYYLKNQTILLDTKYDTEITYTFCLENDSLLEKINEFTKGINPIQVGTTIIEV